MSSEENPSPERRELETPADKAAAFDPALSEEAVLLLLRQISLPAATLETIARTSHLSKSRKVRLAVVEHPHTPRHIAITALRDLFTFDLMRVALQPTVAADIKRAADEALIRRLEMICSGEKLALARRASGRIAAELLADDQPRIVKAALDNPRLTQAAVVKMLMRPKRPVTLAALLRSHPKWSTQPEVQSALDASAPHDTGRDG